MSNVEADPAMLALGRIALMAYRGAREDGSAKEALWATVAVVIGVLMKPDEEAI